MLQLRLTMSCMHCTAISLSLGDHDAMIQSDGGICMGEAAVTAAAAFSPVAATQAKDAYLYSS